MFFICFFPDNSIEIIPLITMVSRANHVVILVYVMSSYSMLCYAMSNHSWLILHLIATFLAVVNFTHTSLKYAEIS